MRPIRIVTQQNLSRIGSFYGAIMALTTIIMAALSVFVFNEGGNANFNFVFVQCINIIFYLVITNHFIKCKSELYYGYIAILLLIISDYILPLLSNFMNGVLNLTVIVPSLTAILGIVYFVFLCLENKYRTSNPKYIKVLKVVGAIFAVLGLVNGITSLVFIDFSSLSAIPYCIYQLFLSIGGPILFAFYPLVLYKDRYL